MSHIMNNNLISPRTDTKKRSTGSLAARSKPIATLNSGRRALSIPPSKCSLCDKKKIKHEGHLLNITHKTLYTKYASSQNYYYTKDINELLADSRTPIVISHKDVQTLDESEEYLKRVYKSSEYNGKMKLLAEYYKFHWDIPRLFMLPTTEVINRYHDRKRRLQYLKVTKMLKEQKDSKDPHAKAKEELKPKTEEVKPMSIADKLLVGLETSHSIIKQEAIHQQEDRGNRTSRQGGETQRTRAPARGQERSIREQRQRKEEEIQEKRKESTFNTLQDLNVKLGEIISNSEFKITDTNYFGRTDQSLNESIGNLKNFLNYLQSNPSETNPAQQPITEIPNIMQQNQPRPPAPMESVGHHTRKSVVIKSITPRPEKPIDDDLQQQGLRSTRAPVMTWSRADSTPMITPSPSELARRGSGGMIKETTKGEPKMKEENHVGGGSSAQTSLSSTMTSKSKSVYSSVTKIRNFEEAVKISQQNSQMKLVSPVDPNNAKHSNKPVMLRVNASGGTQEINQREASPSTEFIYKGMDSSIKTPFGVSDDKSKESNKDISPLSKQTSQLMQSPSGKTNNKLVTTKNTNIYSTRTLEGFMPKNMEMMSPQNQSPNFRIKSHREVGTSFDRNAKESHVQPNSAKQVSQIQLPLAKTHTRFGSGSLISPDGRSSGLKLDTPGREFKNLMTLGTQDAQLKDMKVIPNSASRREALLGKGDAKGENLGVKVSEGSATDREREAPPLSPKVSNTQRGKISHKHTRSEGGKMFKFDQFELPMGSLNDQRIKELLKLNDADGFSDCSQKLKKGEQMAMKKSAYNTSNVANFVLSSNRELNYEGSTNVPSQKKHIANKASADLAISGNIGALISNRNAKADVIVRKKSAVKKGEGVSDGKQKTGVNLGLTLDRFEETKLTKTNKALSVKGSGNFTPSNFSKGSVQKTKGKQDLF